MTTRRVAVWLTALACAGLAGCATTRSELGLPAPGSTTSAASTPLPGLAGKVFVLRSVYDERVFEDAPDDPSTPSLGFGGASKASPAVKARAFGRKRGGFGMALGDILLRPGMTVESVVRDNLAAALRAGGAGVSDAAAPSPGAVTLDVHVKAFWTWMNPGFWALTGNGRIATDIDASGHVGTIPVLVEHKESRQFMPESAWLEVMTDTLDAWRAEAARKLAAALAP